MARHLTVRFADIEDAPVYNVNGAFNDFLDAKLLIGKCFAYVLNDPEKAITPGKGNPALASRRPQTLYELLSGDEVNIINEAPDLPYDGTLESYAKKQWQNVVERDGLIPVAPDESGVLNVPKGTYPVFLSVTMKRDPITHQMKASRHWYRADAPADGTDQVTWSHWDGNGAPKRTAGPDKLTDPWNQCAFDKYRPVGYFLVASKNAATDQPTADTSTAAIPKPRPQHTAVQPAM